MGKILIAQPTRMHAHQLARACAEAGHTVHFMSLLPDAVRPGERGRWRYALSSRFDHNRLDFLPAEQCEFWVGPLVLQKLTFNSPILALSRVGEWAAWALFDRWVSRSIERLRPDLVIGYERSSVETFLKCKRLGIPSVLDAAAEHYLMQQQCLDEERRAAQTWAGDLLVERKKQEIDLADLIITCSPQSGRSYVEAGVPAERVAVNPLGVDAASFWLASKRGGPPKFLFVGNPLPYKGLDRLLHCFESVSRECPGALLNVVGDAGRHVSGAAHSWLVLHGKKTHAQLAQLMSEVDYLVMPSRLESFGLVALEALASGMNVLISNRVGVSGLLPGGGVCETFSSDDDEGLQSALRSACARVEQARTRGDEGRTLAINFGWHAYRERAVALLAPLLGGMATTA